MALADVAQRTFADCEKYALFDASGKVLASNFQVRLLLVLLGAGAVVAEQRTDGWARTACRREQPVVTQSLFTAVPTHPRSLLCSALYAVHAHDTCL